ncbi:hypothetical protein [Candidatus Nitrosacidococcus sp. I8]|uniref:hypothetical protein n=1 Tax=Candidatus Nitrosacidococcus sp. I8 TaxID=2942908 RepID=UPI0022278EA6|nr:hypothetical protein [Candidatus Nitrosacidococcus sp. I8]CAH9016961.1 hypothetical protein NURINAE_00269 [Candidatus Nitrosacidococcus sp. I8]
MKSTIYKIILLYFLIISSIQAAPPQYKIVPLGEDINYIYAVSNSGLILLGTSSYPNVLLRDLDGTLHDISPLQPIVVNDSGVTAGVRMVPLDIDLPGQLPDDHAPIYVSHVFLREANGTLIDLSEKNPDGPSNGNPLAINNKGQLVGFFDTQLLSDIVDGYRVYNSTNKGFVGDINGLADIGTLFPMGNYSVNNLSINDEGQLY